MTTLELRNPNFSSLNSQTSASSSRRKSQLASVVQPEPILQPSSRPAVQPSILQPSSRPPPQFFGLRSQNSSIRCLTVDYLDALPLHKMKLSKVLILLKH
ncbi:hypothetical protein QQ045_002178 [Rhodiola kirilowii]